LNLNKTQVSLDDFKGKYLVIIFYPGDFSNLDPF
jgi:peroxiredoxin